MTSLALSAAAQGAVLGADLAAVLALCLSALAVGLLLAAPVARRRHARLPGVTASEAERLAWGGTAVPTTAAAAPVVAVSVVPSRSRSRTGGRSAMVRTGTALRARTPGPARTAAPAGMQPSTGSGAHAAYGADLDDTLGDEHPVSAPGRHRRPAPGWQVWARRRSRVGDPARLSRDFSLLDQDLPHPDEIDDVPVAPAPVAPAPVGAAAVPLVPAVGSATPVHAPEPVLAPEPVHAPEPVLAPEPVHAPEPVLTVGPVHAPEPQPVVPLLPPDPALDLELPHAEPTPIVPLLPPDPALDLAPQAGEPAPQPPAGPDTAEIPLAAIAAAVAVADAAAAVAVADDADAPRSAGQVAARPAPDAAFGPALRRLDSQALRTAQTSPDALRLAAGEQAEDGLVPADLPQQWGGRSPTPAQRRRLRAASRRLQEAGERTQVARIAVEEAADLTSADWAALVVRSVEGPRVLWLHPGGPTSTEVWGHSTLAALVALGVPFRDLLPDDPLSDGSPTALLTVPVPSAGTMAGSLLVRRRRGEPFSRADEDILTRVARMTGTSLLALTQQGHVPTAVRVDSATGLADRGRMRSDLVAALRTSATHGMPAALLLGEVEGLSRLRTELGPRTADEALAVVVAAVADTLRVGDLLYRFGQDQLAVLLPATSAEAAQAVGGRLGLAVREALAAAELPERARALHLHAAVVTVEGAPDEVELRAERALEARRVEQRWKGVLPASTGGAA